MTEVDQSIPQVVGDQLRIKQILLNYVVTPSSFLEEEM